MEKSTAIIMLLLSQRDEKASDAFSPNAIARIGSKHCSHRTSLRVNNYWYSHRARIDPLAKLFLQTGPHLERGKDKSIQTFGTKGMAPQKSGSESEKDASKSHNDQDDSLKSRRKAFALSVWIVSVCGFLLINSYVGPWPSGLLTNVSERVWFTLHMVSSMLFGGGVILTTCMEWLFVDANSEDALQLYYKKMPLLDALIVLPSLTIAIISGMGLTIWNYGVLEYAPIHIQLTIWCLALFALWWSMMDLATQDKSIRDIDEWKRQQYAQPTNKLPKIVESRKFNNLVSCGFVLALYYIMSMKPGAL